MIDEKKIVGMLQAKALGCLDEADLVELNAFIDSGYVFPWEELGVYQNTASLIPLTLQLEDPQAELKDKVALRLIKLSEEQKAKKAAEEELLKSKIPPEIIEEEIDEKDDYVNLEEPFVDPPIEIEPEQITIEPEQITEISDIQLSEPVSLNDPSFNLDDIVLPGYESENIKIEASGDVNKIEQITEIPLSENVIEEVKIDNKLGLDEIDSVLNNNNWIEPETSKIIEPEIKLTPEFPEIKASTEIKQVETTDDSEKPDLTKRSVAEKVFKAIEQDFDMLKYHSEESERKLKRGLIIAFITIALLAGLLVIMFFKFNAEIENQQKDIEYLKARPTSQLYYPHHYLSTDCFS